MKKKWNESEIKFLKEYYPIKGVEYCCVILHRNKVSVCGKAKELNLIVDKKVKYLNISNKRKLNNYKKYDVQNIINISNKYVAYFLGYFWADGNLIKRNSHLCSINLVENDALFLYELISKFSTGWKLSSSIEKWWKDKNGLLKRAQNQKIIRSYSQELFEFLIKNDYNNKSNTSFLKIWSIINENLKKYFILGLFDGDGTFNYQIRKDKYHSGEFIITSKYEYDWSVLEEYFNQQGISYSIYNLNVELGGVSRIVVRKKDSLIKLFDLLYNNCKFVGLERKYKKFLQYYEKIKE